MVWSNKELSEALGIEIQSKCQDLGVVQFNSKSVNKGDIFIALPGARDGHLFVHDAISRGAGLVIISQEMDDIPEDIKVNVSDTMNALEQLAIYKRKYSKAKIIGITGSVGKTTTKDALGLMLQPFGKTFSSRTNFNNFLGVIINLASMPINTQFGIFELGMNHAGEIKQLTNIVKPDIAIITNISEVHIGNFDSIEGIVDAKSEIFEGMKPNSLIIINNDNQKHCEQICLRAREKHLKNIYFFGTGINSSSKLIEYRNVDFKVEIKYRVNGKEVMAKLNRIPEHFTKNFASNILLIDLLELDINKAMKALEKYKIPDGRGGTVNVYKGKKKFCIIRDYYASNPTSLIAALKHLGTSFHPGKVVIMGDMLELGNRADELHEEVLPHIIASDVKKLVLVGDIAPKLADKIPSTIEVFKFQNVAEVTKNLSSILSDEELILIKGSHKLKMWEILTYFDNNKNVI